MRLQPAEQHPHGLSARDFDALFKPIIFAYHGYPSLIHRLTYRRTNHRNLHVHGYEQVGTTTTPFDMANVFAWVPKLRAVATREKQAIRDQLIEHTRYIAAHGDDMPDVRDWPWGAAVLPP